MSLEELISTYGYMAVGIGTFLEGETILVLAGFACHRGFLEFPMVILSAFLGTLFGDQLYFYIGRIKGKSFLAKRPAWRSKSARVMSLLEKHQVLLILGFRFLYGLRTMTPFLIGASAVKPIRFLILNIIGSFVWALIIGAGGYTFGNVLELLIGDIKKYEIVVFAILLFFGAVIWGIHFTRQYLANKGR